MQRDSAGVVFPPPFIYLAGLLLGIYGGRLLPGALPSSPVLTLLAYVLLALGLLIALSAFAQFHAKQTNVNPNRPATALVFNGPYRFTRNPMYVGLTCVYLAVTLWTHSLWALILLIAVLLIVRYAVIAREERYLTKKFGDAYLAYTARVRRWL
jgi:protein-S-isoprenylcysteine O-methyltransferase Ste14